MDVKWRCDSGGGGGAEGARQEEVVAVTPWPGAQTSGLRGGPKIVATLLRCDFSELN